MSFIKRIALTALSAAITLTLTTGPASASWGDFKDGTKAGQDIKSATVDYNSGFFTFYGYVGKVKAVDVYTLWVDTDPKNSGPEYKMEMMPDSDYLYLVAVDSFASKGQAVKCSSFGGWASTSGGSSVGFDMKRSCIGNPSKVRICFRAKFPKAKTVDYLPAKEKFTSWVRYN